MRETALVYDVNEAIMSFKCPKGFEFVPGFRLTYEQLLLPVNERRFATKINGKEIILSSNAYWNGVKLRRVATKKTILDFATQQRTGSEIAINRDETDSDDEENHENSLNASNSTTSCKPMCEEFWFCLSTKQCKEASQIGASTCGNIVKVTKGNMSNCQKHLDKHGVKGAEGLKKEGVTHK